MINLENDWLVKIVATPSIYYGYANKPIAEDNPGWSIRKVTTSGTKTTVTWSNNQKFNFISKVSEYLNTFDDPAVFGITWSNTGITYSISKSTNSFNITNSNLTVSWNDLGGIDQYYVKVTDSNGVIYNYLNEPFINNYITDKYTDMVQSVWATSSYPVSFNFRGQVGITYSVTIKAQNVAGSIEKTFQTRID